MAAMRKLLLGTGLLLLILTFCLYSAESFEKEVEGLIDYTEKASSLLQKGDRNEALVLIDTALLTWEKNKERAQYFMHDNKLSDITSAFYEYRNAAESPDEAADLKAEELIYLLRDIASHEKFRLNAVF